MTVHLVARPLALAGPAAVAGVLLSPRPAPWAAAVAVLLAVWWIGWRRPAAGLLLVALAAGYTSGLRVVRRADRILASPHGPWPRAPPRVVTCEVAVTRCGEDPFRGRAWLEGRRADGTGLLCAWPGRVPPGVAPGAQVRVAGRCYPPRGPGNPGEADRRAALARRGVALLADLRTVENVVVTQPAPPGIRAWLDRVRRAGARRLARVLPPDTAAVAVALVLGVRGSVAPADRRRFERTGTLHILAISGMHVLLLAGVVHRLLRLVGAGTRTAAGITLGLALLYVPVAGGAPPVRRAVTVLVFYAVALVRGRPPDVASALGGAALVLALADPADVFGIGFRLSFAAAAGIAWLAGPWRERWSRRHRLLARFPAVREDRRIRLVVHGYVLQALPVALAAWLATQGFVATTFGLVTPLAPLANVALGPLVGLLLPLAALVAFGATPLAPAVDLLVRAVRLLLDGVLLVPGCARLVPAPPVAALLLWLAGAAALRRAPRAGCAVLLAAILVAARPANPPSPALVMFDVGHGQAILLRTRDRAVLVDAGSHSRRDAGARIVVPALRALGVVRLDAIVCTHADADHWNAIPALLAWLPVGRVVVGDDPPASLRAAAAARGVPIVRARPGTDLLAGATGARLSVLPGEPPRPDPNEGSLALLFEINGHRVLLPADREREGLAALLAAGLPRCDVLVAPHHGARCELAPRLAAAVRPRLLLVSSRARFADAETAANYRAARAVRTFEHGCVVVTLEPGRPASAATFRAPAACYDPPP